LKNTAGLRTHLLPPEEHYSIGAYETL